MAQIGGTAILFTFVLLFLAVGLVAAYYAAKRTVRIGLRPIGIGILTAVISVLAGWTAMLLLVLFFVTVATEETSIVVDSTGDFQGRPLPKVSSMGGDVSCWYDERTSTSRSVVNVPKWSFHQRINWCGDGTRLVGEPVQEMSWNTHLPFWTFEEHLGLSEGQWGVDRYTASSQVKFRFCTIPHVLCIAHDYPATDMTVYADGTFDFEFDAG